MFEFEKLCKQVEQLDPKTYEAVLQEKCDSVIDGLSLITKDEMSGLTLFYGLVLGAIVSDGKLDEGEFVIIKPFLDKVLDRNFSFVEAQAFIKYLKPETAEYKKFIDFSVDVFGRISEDLKYDMVLVCMLVCGVDSKISAKERKWIKQLVK